MAIGPAYATIYAAARYAEQHGVYDYGEPIVYGQAMRILHGEALYQPIDRLPFTVTAYTPLFYWVAAGLQAFVGSGFGPGRVLSIGAGVLAAVLVGVIAGRRSGQAWLGMFAGLLFLALSFPGGVPWLGLYRVDMLGVVLSIASIAMLSSGRGTTASVVAGVLAGLALLCKQTFIAALIAGTLSRWPDRRQSGAFLVAGVATFAIPCLVLQLTSGAFIQNTVQANLNPIDLSLGERLVREWTRMQWLPLLLAGLYFGLQRLWRKPIDRLLFIYWAASSISLLLLGKVGANHNYWIEFAAATAMLAACGVGSLLRAPNRGLAVLGAILVMVLVGMTVGEPTVDVVRGGPRVALDSARSVQSKAEALFQERNEPEFDSLVDRVRREPGEILAEPMDVIVLAGRPIWFEPLIYSILFDAGQWQADTVVAHICSGQVRLLVLDYPLEDDTQATFGRFQLWAPPVMSALRATMALERSVAMRYIYTAHAPVGSGCASG